ncbi:hypothetical protein [Gilliamella apicola]|nr:hypothetical protein [Gilliamella apicola]
MQIVVFDVSDDVAVDIYLVQVAETVVELMMVSSSGGRWQYGCPVVS